MDSNEEPDQALRTAPLYYWTQKDVTQWAINRNLPKSVIFALEKVNGHYLWKCQLDSRKIEYFHKLGLDLGDIDQLFDALPKPTIEDDVYNVSCAKCNVRLDTKEKDFDYFYDGRNYFHWHCYLAEPALHRETARAQLENAMAKNYENLGQTSKQDHYICTVIGYPGIGKTTVGWKVASNITLANKLAGYAFIDFSSGDLMGPMDYQPDVFMAQLAIRVFMRLMTKKSLAQIKQNNFQIYKQRIEPLLSQGLTLGNVLNYWKSRNPSTPGVILHFDEINYLPSPARKLLVDNLSIEMLADRAKVPFVPLFTGTTLSFSSFLDFSSYHVTKLDLTPLNHDEQMKIVLSNVPEQIGVKIKASEKFKVLLKATHGIPRHVNELRSALSAALQGLPDNVNITGDLIAETTAPLFKTNIEVIAKYNGYESRFPQPLPFLCFLLRGKLLSKDESSKTTLESSVEPNLELSLPGFDAPFTTLPGREGHVVTDLLNAGALYIADNNALQIPYFFAANLVQKGAPDVASAFTAPAKTMTWQQLEDLEPYFLKLLFISYQEVARLCNRSVVLRFADIWCRAVASNEIKNLLIELPTQFSAAKEDHCWISKEHQANHKGRYAETWARDDLLNISGSFTCVADNALVDVRTVLPLSTIATQQHDEHTQFVTEEIAGSKKRVVKSSDSPSKEQKSSQKRLLNLAQMKWSANTKTNVKASEIYAWYQDVSAIELDPQFYVVCTYYTTKVVDYDDMNDEQLAKLKQEQLSASVQSDEQKSPMPGKRWSVERLLTLCPRLVLMSRGQLAEYLSPSFALLVQQD